MTNKDIKVLVVDDEPAIRKVLTDSLRDEGFVVESAVDGLNGMKQISVFRPDVVLLDIWMPGGLDGLDVLKKANLEFPDVEFIIMSGHGTIETAVNATKLGAWDFIEKPISMDKVFILISNIISYQSEKKEKLTLLSRLRKNFAMVGNSSSMKALKQLISRVAPTESWMLISGEQGCGKELVAQNVHYLSERAGKPFVKFYSKTTPEELVDYELFGYEKGAFIGAEQTKKGRLELAGSGTFFIEEIGFLPQKTQVRLLDCLLNGKACRVGGKEPYSVNVRVIASTSESLPKLVEAGKFDGDLYHRLNTIPINLPPLRDKKEDVPHLVDHFSGRISQNDGELHKQFSKKSVSLMSQYEWPGNINELKNFIERLYILTPGPNIEVHDLKYAGLPIISDMGGNFSTNKTFREARAQFEREFLIKKITENDGNISKTAEAIGLERSYLHRKIKLYGIEV